MHTFTFEDLGFKAKNANAASFFRSREELLESLKVWCELQGQRPCGISDLDWPTFTKSVSRCWGKRWQSACGKEAASQAKNLKDAVLKKKSEKHGDTVWKEWVRYWQSKAVDLKV